MDGEITEPTLHLCWNDFAIRGAVHALRMANLDTMADDMEAQLKPAAEEPTEFGSVVRAGVDGLSDRVLWVRCGDFWFTPGMSRAGFEDLYHPEVLRVGIGDNDEWHRLDVANAENDAYTKGAEDMRAKVLKNLQEQLSPPVGYETQIAYRNAIRTAEDTRP